MTNVAIIPYEDAYRAWISEKLIEEWASTVIVTRGRKYEADLLPGFVALTGDLPVGFILYNVVRNECEIVCLNSFKKGIGIGSALIEAVRLKALETNCQRLWLPDC